jgi:hypothetical protein
LFFISILSLSSDFLTFTCSSLLEWYSTVWGGKKSGSGKVGVKRYGVCLVLWPLHVFEYISIVVVEGACVRDCRGLGVCTVCTVG